MPSTDPETAALCRAWVGYQAATGSAVDESHPDHWAVDALYDLLAGRDMDRIWSVITDLCVEADGRDPAVAAMIGADPLEDFIRQFGDGAMDLIEPQLESNPTLVLALAGVWPRDEMRGRVARALAAHGHEPY